MTIIIDFFLLALATACLILFVTEGILREDWIACLVLGIIGSGAYFLTNLIGSP